MAKKSFSKQELQSECDARESLRNIRRISEESISGLHEAASERGFSLKYLRRIFATNSELEILFNKYTERINRAYFSLYLLLQAFFVITHFIVVLVLNAANNTIHIVALDLVLYSLTGLLALIIVYLNESCGKNHKNIFKYSTIVIFLFVFVSDLAIPIYYSLLSISVHLRPAYTAIVLLACYVFCNIGNNLYAFLLGIFVTLCHMLILSFITYNNNALLAERLGADLIYLMCINGIGMCFRFSKELVTRRAFLDHRSCVESTLKLKYEKEQEEQLMLSIIPEHIIKEVRTDILNKIEYIEKMFRIPTGNPTNIPYIQKYDNVTILYADIVNYTAMTSKLPVKLLVETLNDLFSGFDDASEELNVLRIKFLGDCYYCVAGLPPNPAPNHGEACIDLGLRMISIIRIIREKRDLAVDMRIGVHTGSILSGVIGSKKWQFDIWSRDAHIANKMETAGEPGKVHITQQTYNLIQKQYYIVQTQKGSTDPNLISFNLVTYLVSPQPWLSRSQVPRKSSNKIPLKKLSIIGEVDNTLLDHALKLDSETGESNTQRSSSLADVSDVKIINNDVMDSIHNESRDSLRSYTESVISRRPSTVSTSEKRMSGRNFASYDIKRRTAFMDNNIKQYFECLKNTNEKLEEAITELPLTKYEQWFKASNINPFFLLFKDNVAEKNYLKLSDPLFKYYIVVYVLLFVAKIVIQNLTLKQWDWEAWFRYAILFFVLFILIPITWVEPIRSMYYAKNFTDEEDNGYKSNNKLLSLICRLSSIITSNVFVRTGIYIALCGFFISSVLDELIECEEVHQTKENEKLALFRFTIVQNQQEMQCVIPWHMSHTLCLAIVMCFTFMHIQIWLKLLIAASYTIFYSIYVWDFIHYYYKGSETFNYMMEPQVAHIIGLVYLTITLHMLDRQTDYLNRLDYQWTVKLMSEQVEVNTMHKITTMLLKNILPIHVAEIYLDVNRPNREDLYTEEYKSVSVIFASVVDFYMDSFTEVSFLGFMNQIIKEFDLLLLKECQRPIEKIKVTNMTYMAACGLDPGRKDSYGRAETSFEHDVVVTIVKFAVDMVAALNKINRESAQECKLRIGISHGEVMAGVVGSKKPLYDIWGDTVNLASRMDSNGVPGKIQVTENTAMVLEKFKIKCEFRDSIYVKGKQQKVPTYFVALDENDNLIYL